MTPVPPANETTHPSSDPLGSSWKALAVVHENCRLGSPQVGKSLPTVAMEGAFPGHGSWVGQKHEHVESDCVQPATMGLPPASSAIASPSSSRLPPRNDE